MFGPPSRSGLRLRYVTSRILQWSFLVLQSHCLRFFATMTPTEPRPSGSETPHQPSLTVGAPFALCAASHSAIAMQTICRRDDTTEPRPSGSDHDVPPSLTVGAPFALCHESRSSMVIPCSAIALHTFFAAIITTEPRPSGSEIPHRPSLTVGAPFALCAASRSSMVIPCFAIVIRWRTATRDNTRINARRTTEPQQSRDRQGAITMFGPPLRSGLRCVRRRVLQLSFLVLESSCIRCFAAMTKTEPRPSGSEIPHGPSLTVGAPFCAALSAAFCAAAACSEQNLPKQIAISYPAPSCR